MNNASKKSWVLETTDIMKTNMKKIIDYDLERDTDLERMVKYVNKKIEEGWQPFGDIQMFKYIPEDLMSEVEEFVQAIVKYEDIEAN